MEKTSLERKKHWDTVYSEKEAPETSWYQREPALSLAMIENAQIGLDGAIIDIGGGASLLVDRLLQSAYRDISVLDISGHALEQARRRLGSSAKQVQWIEEDVTRFRADRKYALWHDRAAFHFLTDGDSRRHYRDALYRALEPGGQAIIAAFAPDGPPRCSGLDIVRYDAVSLMAELGEEMILLEQKREVHLTPQGREQRFGFYRLQRK
jgi:SAM-dependent methyltransferase